MNLGSIKYVFSDLDFNEIANPRGLPIGSCLGRAKWPQNREGRGHVFEGVGGFVTYSFGKCEEMPQEDHRSVSLAASANARNDYGLRVPGFGLQPNGLLRDFLKLRTLVRTIFGGLQSERVANIVEWIDGK